MKHKLFFTSAAVLRARLVTTLFLLNIFWTTDSIAQANYALSSLSSQTYTALSGTGITIVNTNGGLTSTFGSVTQDDGGILIDLPFTFTYNGNAFTQMSMSCNGWGSTVAIEVCEDSQRRR